jgi:hypothetical protein
MRNAQWPRRACSDLHVPVELGGLGEGLLALAVVTETLAKACSPSALATAGDDQLQRVPVDPVADASHRSEGDQDAARAAEPGRDPACATDLSPSTIATLLQGQTAQIVTANGQQLAILREIFAPSMPPHLRVFASKT